MGVEHTFVDADDPGSWAAALRPTTRAFYVETLTNPLLEVVDLRAVASFCRERRITSIVDNTCATPGQLPARGAWLRPGRAQRDQVPQRPLGHRGRRRRRRRRAGTGRQAQARSRGRLARSARLLPAPSRPQDARAARPPPERERAAHRAAARAARRREARALPGAREPPQARTRARVAPRVRGPAQLRAEGRRRRRREVHRGPHAACERAEPRRRRVARHPPCHDVARGAFRPRSARGWGSRTASSGCPWASRRRRTSSRTWSERSPPASYPASTTARRSRQGLAVSSCAARRNSVASSPKRPVNIVPIGRPSAFQYVGTLIDGWPVTFARGV